MVLEQKHVTKEGLKLELDLYSQEFVEICLFDEIGKLVYNFCDYLSPGHYSHLISTQKLTAGNYLLRVAKNGNTNFNEIIYLK